MPSPRFDTPAISAKPLRYVAEALVLGALLRWAWRACHARHRHRHTARSARAPAAVHTWEGEGGRPLPAEHAASTAATAQPLPPR